MSRDITVSLITLVNGSYRFQHNDQYYHSCLNIYMYYTYSYTFTYTYGTQNSLEGEESLRAICFSSQLQLSSESIRMQMRSSSPTAGCRFNYCLRDVRSGAPILIPDTRHSGLGTPRKVQTPLRWLDEQRVPAVELEQTDSNIACAVHNVNCGCEKNRPTIADISHRA